MVALNYKAFDQMKREDEDKKKKEGAGEEEQL